jgi:hypothetical protein
MDATTPRLFEHRLDPRLFTSDRLDERAQGVRRQLADPAARAADAISRVTGKGARFRGI